MVLNCPSSSPLKRTKSITGRKIIHPILQATCLTNALKIIVMWWKSKMRIQKRLFYIKRMRLSDTKWESTWRSIEQRIWPWTTVTTALITTHLCLIYSTRFLSSWTSIRRYSGAPQGLTKFKITSDHILRLHQIEASPPPANVQSLCLCELFRTLVWDSNDSASLKLRFSEFLKRVPFAAFCTMPLRSSD